MPSGDHMSVRRNPQLFIYERYSMHSSWVKGGLAPGRRPWLTEYLVTGQDGRRPAAFQRRIPLHISKRTCIPRLPHLRRLLASAASMHVSGEGHGNNTLAERGQSSPLPHADLSGGPVPSSPIHPLQLAAETLWPDRYLALGAAVVVVLTIGLTLAFPLAIGDLFDVVRQHVATAQSLGLASSYASSGGSSLSETWMSLTTAVASAPKAFRSVLFRLCLFLIFSAVGNAAVAYLAQAMSERFAVRLRKRIMAELLTKDQAYFDGQSKGDLTALLSLDVGVVQATVTDFLGQRGFRSMFEVIGSLLIISSRSPYLAAVSFAVTPALSALLRRVVAHSAKLTFERQQAAARAMAFATERLTHVRTVQLFAAEDREGVAYEALTAKGLVLARRCAKFQGLVEGAGRLAVNVGTVSLLGLGGALVLAGRISLGTLLSANVYNLFLSVGLSSLAGSVGDLGKAVGAMERICNVFDGNVARDPAAFASEVAGPVKAQEQLLPFTKPISVEFDNVWFRYPGKDTWALQGLSLRIPPGSTVALVGPSGGGKSTTAALLLGLYRAQKGKILYDGVILNEDTIPGARASIGTVLQRPSLLSGKVIDQLRLGAPEATLGEIEEAIKASNAEEFVGQLPFGVYSELTEGGRNLSGGQQQRLAIARALVRKPRLLLLDEPTAALDVDAERAIDSALSSLQGCTKIIIAHRLSTVRRADIIAVVVDGRVAEVGSHDDLMTQPEGRYRKMIQTYELGGIERFDDVDAAPLDQEHAGGNAAGSQVLAST